MTPEKETRLTEQARRVRAGIVYCTHEARSGHPGGSLSCADLLTYLYQEGLHVSPNSPEDESRDRFVLSKGHATPAYYSALALSGFFDPGELKTFRACGSRLQGHPNMNLVPGVDMSTGSLGQGLSAAAGMALGARLTGKEFCTFALLGDGETAEGQIWEAMLFAAHHRLDNLAVYVDVNGLQIDGKTEEVLNTRPLGRKFESFGASVLTIDGHSFADIENSVNWVRSNRGSGKPSVVLMKTVKGKGISFMENNAGWHGKAPNQEEYETAMQELGFLPGAFPQPVCGKGGAAA